MKILIIGLTICLGIGTGVAATVGLLACGVFFAPPVYEPSVEPIETEIATVPAGGDVVIDAASMSLEIMFHPEGAAFCFDGDCWRCVDFERVTSDTARSMWQRKAAR